MPGNDAKDSRSKHLPLVDSAICFVITRRIVVLVVDMASVLLLRLDVGKTGEGTVPGRLYRHKVDAYRSHLVPVDALIFWVVRIGQDSAHRCASSSWTWCEVFGRGHTHRATYNFDNYDLSSIEARNRVWASRTADSRRAGLTAVASPIVDPDRSLLVYKENLGRTRNFRLL